MKEKKLKIEDLKIQSFVTQLSGQTETVHLVGGTLETNEQSCNNCYSNQGTNCEGTTTCGTGQECWTEEAHGCTAARPCTGGLCEQSANPPCY